MLVNKLISIAFRLILLTMIIVNYIYVINYTWLPYTLHNQFAWAIVFIFHFLLIMVIWTILVTSSSDPGQVPLYWGFYLGDSDNKRRRYCLMCNVFKPDRCHHCSICNRCVLNMDHHCPWINNCIGFFNRKYFMQMLFYMNMVLVFILLVNCKFTVEMILKIIRNRVNLKNELTQHLGHIFIYIIDIAAEIIIGLFFKFHLKLVFENKTTIETIDKKGMPFESGYDRGLSTNWWQVMGTSKLLWFFPLKIYFGIPKGNGVDWQEPLIDEKKLTHNENLPGNQMSNYNSKASNYKSNYLNKDDLGSSNKNQIMINPSSSLSSLYNRNVEPNKPSPATVDDKNSTYNNHNDNTSSQVDLIQNSRSASPIMLKKTDKGDRTENTDIATARTNIELQNVKINDKAFDDPQKVEKN